MRPSELRLLTQKIKQLGYAANEVDISEYEDFTRIKVLDSRLWFAISPNPRGFDSFMFEHTVYAPHYPTVHVKNQWYSTQAILDHLANWFEKHVKPYQAELNIQDPIAEFKRESAFEFNEIKNDDEGFFNAEEKERINNFSEEVKKFVVENYTLPAEKIAFIEKELKYLRHSAERLNKRDFKAVGPAILVNIGVNLTSDAIIYVANAVLQHNIPELFKNFILNSIKLLLE